MSFFDSELRIVPDTVPRFRKIKNGKIPDIFPRSSLECLWALVNGTTSRHPATAATAILIFRLNLPASSIVVFVVWI